MLSLCPPDLALLPACLQSRTRCLHIKQVFSRNALWRNQEWVCFHPGGSLWCLSSPSPQGVSPFPGRTQALQLGRKLWTVVFPLRTQLFPDRWGHITSACQVMEGTWLEHCTMAKVGTATVTWAPWEGCGETTRCTQR